MYNVKTLPLPQPYLSLNKILAVEVPVTPHCLVQVLLLLQFSLRLRDLFLVVKDWHLPDLDLLHVLKDLLREVTRLVDVSVPLLLQLVDNLTLLLRLLVKHKTPVRVCMCNTLFWQIFCRKYIWILRCHFYYNFCQQKILRNSKHATTPVWSSAMWRLLLYLQLLWRAENSTNNCTSRPRYCSLY